MDKVTKNKKAFSPIKATLFLVAICILAGALIMKFGGDYVKNITTETEEYKSSLSCGIDEKAKIIGACFDRSDEKINLVIENSQNSVINNENFYIKLTQEFGFDLKPFFIEKMDKAEIQQNHLTYNPNQGIPQRISLVQVIKQNKKETLCLETAKEVYVDACASR